MFFIAFTTEQQSVTKQFQTIKASNYQSLTKANFRQDHKMVRLRVLLLTKRHTNNELLKVDLICKNTVYSTVFKQQTIKPTNLLRES